RAHLEVPGPDRRDRLVHRVPPPPHHRPLRRHPLAGDRQVRPDAPDGRRPAPAGGALRAHLAGEEGAPARAGDAGLEVVAPLGVRTPLRGLLAALQPLHFLSQTLDLLRQPPDLLVETARARAVRTRLS